MGEPKGGATNPSQARIRKNNPNSNLQHASRSKAKESLKGEDKQMPGLSTIRLTGKCLPKAKEVPTLQIHVDDLRAHIQPMKDHALVKKFVHIWPSEKALSWWINVTWKPQGHYDLHLGAKGFFTVSFLNLEDKNRIFEGVTQGSF